MAISIWETDPRHWPKASREYVFLAAAFHEVGQALWGADWTGREALPITTPEADKQRRLEGIIRASRIHPAATARNGGAPRQSPPAWPFSAEQKAEYAMRLQQKIEAERAAKEQIIARGHAAVEWISSRAREGDLLTFGLWIGGGVDLVALGSSVWNVSHDWSLFASCQVKRSVGVGISPIADWIFLGRESLDRCLNASQGDLPEGDEDEPRGSHVMSSVRAINECETWLRQQFDNSETAMLSRDGFKVIAVEEKFAGRLSGRGFRTAWASAVKQHPSRTMPGPRRPKKSSS